MSTTPRLVHRSTRQVEFVFRNKTGVAAWSVQAANTLDQAFTATTAMFRVIRDGTYRSPGIIGRRLGHTQYNDRGLARALFDFEDFWAPAGTLPHDKDQSYVRIREVDQGGALRPEGPVFVVPPPTFFVSPRPVLTLAGTAPSVAATATGTPPTGSMHVITPRFFDYCGIRNRSGANDIYLSFGMGSPEILVPSGGTKDIYDAADSEIIIRGDGGTAAFDAQFAIVNGEMA